MNTEEETAESHYNWALKATFRRLETDSIRVALCEAIGTMQAEAKALGLDPPPAIARCEAALELIRRRESEGFDAYLNGPDCVHDDRCEREWESGAMAYTVCDCVHRARSASGTNGEPTTNERKG